jgi:flagellar hook-associated protein FlgK
VGTPVSFSVTLTDTTTPAAGDVRTVTPTLAGAATTGAARTTRTVANLNPVLGTLTNFTATVVATTGVTTYTTVANTVTTSGVTTYTFTPDIAGVYLLSFLAAGTGATASPTTPGATFTLTASATGATFIGTGGQPAPVAATVTSASALVAVAGGFARFGISQGGTDRTYYITSTGMNITAATATGGVTTTTNINGTTVGGGVIWLPTLVTDALAVTVTSAVAGTGTLTVQTINSSGVPVGTLTGTVTWGSQLAASTQYSLVKLLSGIATTDVATTTLDTTATTVSSAAGTQRFTIQVETNDQNESPITMAALGASISGPGLIGLADSRGANAATGRSLTIPLTGAFGSVAVFGDGTSGVATITITVTNSAGVTTVLGTKSVTFVGSPATATVTQNLRVARAGTLLGLTPTTSRVTATSAATTPAFRASVVDANGVGVVAGSTVRMVSSDETVIVPGTCAEYTVTGSTTAAVPAPGTFECSVSGAVAAASGKTATITFQVLNAVTGLYSIVAAPITFSVGGAIASTVVSANKTTFAPGEAIVMVATAKDSAGNAAFDGQNPYIATSANMSVGGALPTAAGFIVGGVHSTKSALGVDSLFAPGSTGALTVSGLTAATATAPAGAAFSASLTIASQANADITALTTLVNSLIAKINALNKLVIKIQKKVKA